VTPDGPLPPGSTIGILGGGQLGRMLAMAAAELGFRTHVYVPDGDNPAAGIADAATIAEWNDGEALDAFAAAIDVATYEFENVPEETVRRLSHAVAVRPGAGPLAVAQDRLAERTMAVGIGLGVAPFAPVDTLGELEAAFAKVSPPAILKTRRLGYDGKGQAAIDRPEDAGEAWQAIGAAPAILERRIAFRTEISVLIARGFDGSTAAFDIPENRHEGGILATSMVPAAIAAATALGAVAIAERIAAALDHVGVLAVELFVVAGDGGDRLLVNEIAPRVHNSGHWTQDGCYVSQFEQHIRAIAGWPLGDPRRHSHVTMTNLIGDDVAGWAGLAAEPGARLHLYGKLESRPGRKMGHVNRIRGLA
jgi:5-(carboxyamino)imidazole ribonucleotide synthase